MSPFKPMPASEPRSRQPGIYPAWSRLGNRRGKSPTVSPTVTIFGAGIAGLSAAHELIERGFSVQVVEPAPSPDEEYAVEVGGMASNQFGRIKENPVVLHGPEPTDEDKLELFRENIEKVLLFRSADMRSVQPRIPIPARIRFVRKAFEQGQLAQQDRPSELDLYLADEWGGQNGVKLVSVWETIKSAYSSYMEDLEAGYDKSSWMRERPLPLKWRCREVLFVEIRGHTNGDQEEETNRDVSLRWAREVLGHLRMLNARDGYIIPQTEFEFHFRCVDVGSAEPLGDQREEACRSRSNRVEFRVVEQLVPGEHGYRFFPAFYRHLFDTMRRTPILDERGRETGQTAYERLVPTRDFGIGLRDGRETASVQTRRVRSLEELRRHFELFFQRLGASHRDVARFEVRMLKFLTSSSQRRQREYESQSWWQFLGGDMERGYSDKMKKYLTETPQALVAMNAEETDARSQGNIVGQLQIHYLQNQFDSTLNGPTTSAWLREWKRYLKRQGVRFFVGELGKLAWERSELVPVTTTRSGWLEPRRRDLAGAHSGDDDEVPAGKVPPEVARAGAVAPPLVRPPQPGVKIEVMGHDDGEYAIFVDGTAFSVDARKMSCADIAAALAAKVDTHAAVSADADECLITITEARQVRLQPNQGESFVDFDDSLVAGTWKDVRRIDLKRAAEQPSAAAAKRLSKALDRARMVVDGLDKLDAAAWEEAVDLAVTDVGAVGRVRSASYGPLRKHLTKWHVSPDEQTAVIECMHKERRAPDGNGPGSKSDHGRLFRQRMARPRGEHPAFATLTLDESDWVSAGRLRVVNRDFNKALSDYEQRRKPRREIVPYISIEKGELVLAAPAWISDVTVGEGRRATNFDPVYPYYFRTRSTVRRSPSVLMQVRDPHEHLRILGEPLPENSNHDYRSYTERRVAFRPDFYVLALPFDAVSKLVWRAEADRPGYLDGCLAELLQFDRRSNRRSQTGDEQRLIRDIHGRPPRDYPLRDFSGVQYYFHNHVRIGKGHIYFPDAEWGLSSVSQLAYWRERISSTGAFMGQLSVDIGDFYTAAPARRGGRITQSAWHSTLDEIVREVWHQVRQGLERDRAGILADPDYVHLDEGLLFDHALGSSFREEVAINVGADQATADYTVWVNGQPFTHSPTAKESDKDTAEALCDAINSFEPSGTVHATVERQKVRHDMRPSAIVRKTEEEARAMVAQATMDQLDELQDEERRHPTYPGGRSTVNRQIYARRKSLKEKRLHPGDGKVLLRLTSNVPFGAALVCVTGAEAGSYELVVGNKPYRYAQTVPQAALGETWGREAIRNALFEQIVHDPDPSVTAQPKGMSGLLLLPTMGTELPALRVVNKHQHLSLIFGPMLHVRLEQCHGKLSFEQPRKAIIGYNRTPFLINVPGQWQHRPGVLDPSSTDLPGISPNRERNEPVFYNISNRRWVAAGTFMATTTRLTTMEAANEAARHAVNAILYQLVLGPGNDYNAQGRMFADWAEIWDPEKNELDDLEPLKRLDQKLMDEGLPHVLDILKVIETVDALPMHGQPSHDPMANLLHLFQHAGECFDRDWGFAKETLHGLLGQAAERAHDQLDPLGILRALKGTPANLAERLQRAFRSFMDDSGRDANQAGRGNSDPGKASDG